MKKDSLSMLQADSLKIQTLTLIKQSSEGLMKVYSRNLLYGIQGFSDYSEPYQLPQPGFNPSKVQWKTLEPSKKNSLKIYPNPAKSYTVVEYYVENLNTNCVLKFYCYSGKLLKEYIINDIHGYINVPLETFSSGLYICSLECENKVLESVRLIIIE